jgi:hypothetical protein
MSLLLSSSFLSGAACGGRVHPEFFVYKRVRSYDEVVGVKSKAVGKVEWSFFLLMHYSLDCASKKLV